MGAAPLFFSASALPARSLPARVDCHWRCQPSRSMCLLVCLGFSLENSSGCLRSPLTAMTCTWWLGCADNGFPCSCTLCGSPATLVALMVTGVVPCFLPSRMYICTAHERQGSAHRENMWKRSENFVNLYVIWQPRCINLNWTPSRQRGGLQAASTGRVPTRLCQHRISPSVADWCSW